MTRSPRTEFLPVLKDHPEEIGVVPTAYGRNVGSTTLSTAHFDRQMIEEVPLKSWDQLFTGFGKPSGLPAKVTYDAIAKALLSAKSDVPAALIAALDTLADLAHDDGREAILAAAQARAIDTRKWKDEESPSELAARLCCESLRNAKLRECLLHARVIVWDKAATKRFNEYAGREPRAISKPAKKTDLIRSAVSEWCSKNGRGPYADVLVLDDDVSNEIRLEIFHAHRQQSPLVVEGNKRLRRPQRLAHCDSLRYDPTLGRLRIAARSAPMVDWYRSMFGRVFFGDFEFFAQGRICDLRALQQRGQRALDAHTLGHAITRARLREVLWQPDDRDSLWLRSGDCFEAAERRELDLRGGDLLEAKIDLWFAEGGRRITVTAKVPNRIDFRRDARAELVDAYVSQIGIRRAGNSEEDQDLWTMAPWRHPQAVWRAAIGQHTDQLASLDVLKRVALDTVSSPDSTADGRKLRVERAEEDGISVLVGLGDDDDLSTRALTTSDIEGLELDPVAYATVVQKAIGATGRVMEVGKKGTYAVGSANAGNTRIAFYLVAREPATSSNLVATLTASNKGRPVLLVPQGKSTGLQLPEVELPFPLPAVIDVLPQAIEALDLQNEASAIEVAPSNARLVFDADTDSVWLLRKLLELDGQPKTLLLELLKRYPRAVSTEEMERLLGSGRSDKGATKQAKSRLLEQIKEQVPEVSDDLIQTKRNVGLMLTIEPWTPTRR